MRSKKPTIIDDVRMLLKIIPFGEGEATIRTAIGYRLAVDESSGLVMGSGRERIQREANVPAKRTFDRAMGYVQEAGLYKTERRYSVHDRRASQHEADYSLTRGSWPDTAEELTSRVSAPSKAPSGGRRVRHKPVTAIDVSATDGTEVMPSMAPRFGVDGIDLYKDNGEVTAKLTAPRDNGAGSSLPKEPTGANPFETASATNQETPRPPLPPVAQATENQQPTEYRMQRGDVSARGDGTGVELVNGLKAKWIELFGGDATALEIALAGVSLQINSASPWEAQISRQLSRQAQDVRQRKQNYQAAVNRNSQNRGGYGGKGPPDGMPSIFK